MNTADFDYILPEELIAQSPAEKRDCSKLLVYDRATKQGEHTVFSRVGSYLKKGDVLVLNETKVLPARLFGKKREGSANFEFLLLKRLSKTNWDIIMKPAKRLKIGQCVDFAENFSATLVEKKEDGVCEVCFSYTGIFEELLEEYGQLPLPPYIKEQPKQKERYQTVYAKTQGSAAAPTAGLHFTQELLQELQEKGVIITKILLHVGLGTFRPMKDGDINEHIMHSEYYSVSESAADTINAAKKEGRRVVAVGTTSVRTLESVANDDGSVVAKDGDTDIFIYPGYKFKTVDAIITNFHLPKSTLLMLVSAFCGREEMLELYKKAVDLEYRFFSFGDAMLLL